MNVTTLLTNNVPQTSPTSCFNRGVSSSFHSYSDARSRIVDWSLDYRDNSCYIISPNFFAPATFATLQQQDRSQSYLAPSNNKMEEHRG